MSSVTLWAPGGAGGFEAFTSSSQPRNSNSRDLVDAEVALAPAASGELSAPFGRGDVGRIIRRSALTALLLRNNDVDNWALQVLVEAIMEHSSCNISCLDLGYNGLGPEACLTLVPLLHRPPRANNNAANDAPGGALKRAISTKAGMELRRASSAGVAPLIPNPGLPQLVGTGGANHSLLLQLVLAGNAIGDAGAEAVCKLVATGDSLLQLLDLSRCSVTERASSHLKGLLEGARQLQVLRLGWNNLSVKGGAALAAGLKYCSTLQQLLLPWSGIGDEGASAVAAALEHNSSIKLLDMSGCKVSAKTCIVLVETLSVNRELQLLVLQDNPLGASGAQRLLRAVHAGKLVSAAGQHVQKWWLQ
eukprot:gene4523-4775_t